MAPLNPVDRPYGSPVISQEADGPDNGPARRLLIADEFEHSPTLHAHIESLTVCVLHALPPKLARSEFIMNVPSAFKLSAIAFTGIVVLLTFSKHVIPKVQAHESEGCSVATLNGAYGLVLKGEVFNVGPIVAVGVSTFDGKGHFVAEQTVNLNGNVVQAPLTGTYTVNRDCTGIADAVGTGLHSFVIIDGGKQMDLMDNNSAEVLTIHFTTIGSGTNDHHGN
jgi:hypothetical protein